MPSDLLQYLLENKLAIALVSFTSGILGTLLVSHIQNKRALFTYSVTHNRLASTANDRPSFGTIRILRNDTQVRALFASNVILRNESYRDFENIVVRIYCGSTRFLATSASLEQSTYVFDLTNEYKELIRVPDGAEPTELQWGFYNTRRDYLVTTLNRRQNVIFECLNEPDEQDAEAARRTAGADDSVRYRPVIYADIMHKGVRLKARAIPRLIFDVNTRTASLTGVALGVLLYAFLISATTNAMLVGFLMFVYGSCILIPGAWTIRAIRKLADLLGS